ncbi:MAG: DUF1847 domain-containing protein [Candidatus Heimdallarchaeota archaeon]
MSLEKNEGSEENIISPTCFKCNSGAHCTIGRANNELETCPMTVSPEVTKEAMDLYNTDEFIKKSTNVASIVEATGYMHWPRLKDTIEYAKGMGFKKIGLASCVALQKETEKTAEILANYGFEVCSICCKTGSIKKSSVGVPDEYIMISKTGYPIGIVTCNPVAQALLLNKAKTEFNLIIGLCVGHDVTFTRLSEAPVSTFIAKDRSNPHNPVAVLFSHYGNAFFSADLKESKVGK